MGGGSTGIGAAHAPGRTITIGDDLTVHRLGFGAMRLVGPAAFGHPEDRGQALAVLRRAVELGVDLIDTADVYGPEIDEELIADALHPYPEGLVIATKGGNVRLGHLRWAPDGRPEHLRAACEGSLRRLRLEQLPLYQWHRPDPAVPFEDSLGALVELRDEGKIGHLGLSNVTLDQFHRARAMVPVASVQVRFNPLDRAATDLLDACEATGTAFLPWGPLSWGRGTDDGPTDAIATVADGRRVSPQRVALAWLLARSPVVVPIPGTSSIAHLDDNLAARSLHLDPRELALLDGALLDGAPVVLSEGGPRP